jgi:hypothetical protein
MDEPMGKAGDDITTPISRAVPKRAAGPLTAPSSPRAKHLDVLNVPTPRRPVTAEDVLQWGEAAGWTQRLVTLVNPQTIANHCNRTWHEQEKRKERQKKIAGDMDNIRYLLLQIRNREQALRQGLTTLIQMIKTADWTEDEQYSGGLAELQAYRNALVKEREKNCTFPRSCPSSWRTTGCVGELR